VYLRDTTKAKDIPEIWYQVRKKIQDIRGQFPQGIQGPPSTTNSVTCSARSTPLPPTA
jgi:multidrug efflux pump subunit AcrB